MHDPRLDSTARHPDRKTPRVVIPAVVLPGQLPLAIRRPPELSTPNHEGIFEQATLLQILHQGIACLIHILGLQRQIPPPSSLCSP